MIGANPQVVGLAVALLAAGASLLVPVEGLASGVYTLRLQAGAATVVKRVVVE